MKVITSYPIIRVNGNEMSDFTGYDGDELSSANGIYPTPTGEPIDTGTGTPFVDKKTATPKVTNDRASKIDSLFGKGLSIAQIALEFKKAGQTPPTDSEVKAITDGKSGKNAPSTGMSTTTKVLIGGGIALALVVVFVLIKHKGK